MRIPEGRVHKIKEFIKTESFFAMNLPTESQNLG